MFVAKENSRKEDTTKRGYMEFNFKEGDKVMISPIGSDVVGEDGRSFSISPDIIKDLKTHIPLDENHNYGRAVGWFSKDSLEVREDGIYASLELNNEGKSLVENKAYRYLSPVYIMADNRVVVGIDSVGLVNTPNLLFKELNKKENAKEQNSVDEATKAALAEKDKKIAELEAKVKELETAKVELEAKVAELEAAAQTNAANAKAAKVDALIATGAILEDQKELALEMNDKQLDIFVEQNKKLLDLAGGRLKLETNGKGGDGLAEDELKICKQLGLSPEEYKKTKGDN